MNAPVLGSSTFASAPATARVAVAGWTALGDGLLEALERRGFAARTAFSLTHCEAHTFVADCAAVVLVVQAGEEAAALRHCARVARRFAGSIMVLYLGPDPGFAIAALDAGADDCVRLPVNTREVVARLRSALRRRSLPPASLGFRRLGDLALDPVQLRVQAPEQRDLFLTQAQFRLLSALMRDPGAVVSRARLIAEALGEDSDSFDRAIDVQVCRLRKRLASIGLLDFIQTVPGAGYRLNPAIC